MAYWVSIKSVWSFVVVEECSYRNKNHPLKTASIRFSTDVGEPIQRRYASAQMREVFKLASFAGFQTITYKYASQRREQTSPNAAPLRKRSRLLEQESGQSGLKRPISERQ
jgi:hypothetical protein